MDEMSSPLTKRQIDFFFSNVYIPLKLYLFIFFQISGPISFQITFIITRKK